MRALLLVALAIAAGVLLLGSVRLAQSARFEQEMQLLQERGRVDATPSRRPQSDDMVIEPPEGRRVRRIVWWDAAGGVAYFATVEPESGRLAALEKVYHEYVFNWPRLIAGALLAAIAAIAGLLVDWWSTRRRPVDPTDLKEEATQTH